MKLEQPRSLHEGTGWPTIMYKLSWVALIISVLPSSKPYMYIRSNSELTLPCVHLKEGDGVSLVRCAVEFTGKAMVPYTYSFVLQSQKCWICRTAHNHELILEEAEIVQHFYQIGMCCCDYMVGLMPSKFPCYCLTNMCCIWWNWKLPVAILRDIVQIT